MPRVFEGVLARQDLRWRLHIDYASETLFVRALRDGRWLGEERQFRATDLLLRSAPLNAQQRRGMGWNFVESQMRGDAAFGSYMEALLRGSPTNPMFVFPRNFDFLIPGVNLIRAGAGWNEVAFAPLDGEVIDLSGADFSRAHFADVDFSQATVSGVRFSGVHFERCRFGRTQLVGAQLDGIRLGGALVTMSDIVFYRPDGDRNVWRDLDLSGATLAGAELSGARLSRCVLAGTNLSGLRLREEGGLFEDCDGRGARFDDAQGSALRFIHCDLSDASFHRAAAATWVFARSTLRNTSFKDADLSHAPFTRTQGPALNHTRGFAAPIIESIDLDNADLAGADFSGMDLVGKVRIGRGLRFGRDADRRTRLVGASFALSMLGRDCAFIDATDATIHYDIAPEAGITGFIARGAILPRMEWAGFRLRRANFSGAILNAANFGNADLHLANFTRAELHGADFTGAWLAAANFSSAFLTSANFTSAWLYQATFTGTVLGDTNFSSAMLRGVGFNALQGLSITGVNFSNAFLAQANFNAVRVAASASQRTSFAEACLAGADFSGALLGDALLTNAYVSTARGTLSLSFPRSDAVDVDYDATQIVTAATAAETTCPDGRNGPCSPAQLRFRVVGAVWPPDAALDIDDSAGGDLA